MHLQPPPSPCSPSRRVPRSRGFTLVELMVAITGGLFLSVVVFSLSRQGTQFYQQEMRVAAATNGAIVGFERLRTDITRAGFMASPNVRRDPAVCGDPVGNTSWPAGLKQLASITIGAGPGMPAALATQVNPQALTLAGSFSTIEAFPTAEIHDDGVNFIVSLQPDSAPMVRIGYSMSLAAADQVALLARVFGVGRALRIVQRSTGKVMYGSIAGVAASSGTQRPYISLSRTPLLPVRGGTTLCGLESAAVGDVGDLVNPVSFVHYDIADLHGDPNYATIFSATSSDPYDVDRRELRRVELDVTGAEIAGTQELVAEYGVDLQFGLTVINSVTLGADPALKTLLPGDPDTALWAGPTPGLAANQGPELIRAVRTRLSVRSREADRNTGVTATSTVAPGLYRIGLGTNGGAPYARVRTLQADIALRNQTGVYW